MEIANIIAQALMYSLPALLVLIAVKMVLDHQLKKDAQTRGLMIKAEVIKEHFPLRLAAYERCILYLERISPAQLFTRCVPVGKNAKQYYEEITFEIRSEYEHNLTQQTYITPHAWGAVVMAKDQMLTLIRETYDLLPPNSDGLYLANSIIKSLQEEEKIPTYSGILVLKGDTNSFFQF